MKSRNPNKRLLYRIIAFAVSKPLIVLGLVVVLTAVFAFFAVRIQVKPDVISLLPEDNTDEAPGQERKDPAENAGEEFLIIAIEGDDIFSPDVLSLYYDVLEQVVAIEGIEPGITPFNLTVFEKRGGRLVMGPPVPRGRPPGNKEQAEQFREKLLSTRYARNFIISEDGTLLSAFLPAVKRDSYGSLMERIREITRPLEELTATYVSGSIPFVERTEVYLSRNFIRLLILASVIILFMYYLSFRSFRAVLLPTVVVLLGTLWTIGFMSMMGFAVTIITIITPPLVLTLGSSYSIHILNQYYRESKPGL